MSLESSQNFVMNVDQEFKILEESLVKNTHFFKDQFENIKPSFQTLTVNYNSVEDGLNDLFELDIETKRIQHSFDAISRTKNEVNGKLKVVHEHVDSIKDKTQDLSKKTEDSDKQLELLKMNLGGKEKIIENSRKTLQGDLKKWKDVLGLELATSTRGGTVFTFTNIEKQDPSRKFMCHLGLSNTTTDVKLEEGSKDEPARYNRKYIEIDCDPALPKLDELVNILNKTNDLSGFVQKIHQKFKEIV